MKTAIDKKRLFVIFGGVVFVVVVSASIALMSAGDSVPDASSQTQEEIKEYMQSADFRNLSDGSRKEYFRGLMQVREQQMTAQAEEYASLPFDQRVAYMDEAIDEMQARRKEMGDKRESGEGSFRGGPGGGGGMGMGRRDGSGGDKGDRDGSKGSRGEGGKGKRGNPEQKRARTEHVDPRTRAILTKYRQDMRARMEQRGIEPKGGGGKR